MIPVYDKHPFYFQHIMVDLETTGVSPDRNHLIQIAAVRFNLQTQEYDPNLFEVCLSPTANFRCWDEPTRQWWHDPERQPLLDKIIENGISPAIALDAFNIWLGENPPPLVFWGNRNGFDYMFLQSYFKDFGKQFKFDFWNSKDLLSYTEGLFNGAGKPFFRKKDLAFVGEKHNAKDDVLHQLKYLFMCEQMAKAEPTWLG